MTVEQNLALLRVVAAARTQARRLFEDRLREVRRESLLFRRRMCKIDVVGQALTSAAFVPGLVVTHGAGRAGYVFAVALWVHMALRSYRRMRRIDRDLAELEHGVAN